VAKNIKRHGNIKTQLRPHLGSRFVIKHFTQFTVQVRNILM